MSIELLKKYDKLYEIGLSIVSDTEYDNLKDSEREKNPNDPYFDTVGFIADSRDKVKLPFVLGSLNKHKFDLENDTITKWLNKQDDHIVIEPKLDGMSIAVNWFNGEVVTAFRRGDGEYGMNITTKAKKFVKPIKEKRSVWARGEVLLESIPEGYKTKRNAVAGIINEENSEHLKLLVPMFYEYLNGDFDTEHNRTEALRDMDIPTIDTILLHSIDITQSRLTFLLKQFKDRYPDFDLDGLVLAKNICEREDVKYPELKIAFKVNQRGVETTITNIEFETSRAGRVVPTVCFEPIVIDNVTITRATGFNAKYIQDNKLRKGSRISVCRSGQVIPFIDSIISA